MDQNPSYHVVTLEIPQSEQEEVQGILYAHGCLGLEEETGDPGTVRLRSYFDAAGPLSEFAALALAWIPRAKLVHSTTFDLNALQAMIPTFEPVEVLPGIHIIPPEDVPHKEAIPSGKTLIIRPGMGFGTGRHETTQLVMKAMAKHAPQAKSLLDVGSGSGVLSIFGEKILGIPAIDAVEIDAHARENAQENFDLNHTSHITQYIDIHSVTSRRFDLIVANIISSTLIYLKNHLLNGLNPGGLLILSGILDTEKDEILEAFTGIPLIEITQDKEWLAFAFRK